MSDSVKSCKAKGSSDRAERDRNGFILGQVVREVGEGNGTPLQYSCLENPMDRGAWWAAVHEVARSRT